MQATSILAKARIRHRSVVLVECMDRLTLDTSLCWYDKLVEE